jgi:ferredoxin
MKTINLQPLNDDVSVHTQTSILDTLLSRKCDVLMACGGKGICSTCHVYVQAGMEGLTPMTEREKSTLGMVTGTRGTSRLACQARVVGDGVVIELPEGMYIQSLSDLDALIGRRAEQPILHPLDARVLIAKGKIITRSQINQLSGVNFDIVSLRSSTRAD